MSEAPEAPVETELTKKQDYINALIKSNGEGLNALQKSLLDKLVATATKAQKTQQDLQRSQQLLQQAQQTILKSQADLQEANGVVLTLMDLMWEHKTEAEAAS